MSLVALSKHGVYRWVLPPDNHMGGIMLNLHIPIKNVNHQKKYQMVDITRVRPVTRQVGYQEFKLFKSEAEQAGKSQYL